MEEDIWLDRYASRIDLSTYLTHLVKPKFDEDGYLESNIVKVLQSILESRTIIGSTTKSGFIVGTKRAVCFQDAPLLSVFQNVLHEKRNREQLGNKTRYVPTGLAFKKKKIYQAGGRPVIYEQTKKAKEMLPQDEWWRIVNFDLNSDNIIDWTHEREWRVPGDFQFELEDVILIVPKYSAYRLLFERFDDSVLKSLGGITVLGPFIY
ncbi:hypothetical protein SAMN04489762_3467 [Terribacillus saccharophilus]|uniref:DUF2971 domain-containing protein n=1 Tax=Terribacillus saccharophilus TaxID=361277 RepID=A0AAX2EJV2_9BACI|nr:hypothetical protein SAMN04489762_3467 [Terribacillus saccharophilus]